MRGLKECLSGIVVVCALMLAAPAMSQPSSFRLVCDIWPPYQIEERGGGVSGFSVDLVSAMFKRMGTTIQGIGAYPWKRALSTLESGYADALFSANYTPDRTEFAIYPDEVLVESPWVVWTRGDNAVNSLDELKGKRVGVVLGYSYTKEFWEFIETYSVVERVFTDKTNFKKLDIGRLDAIVAEFGNGRHIVQELGLEDIHPNWGVEIKRDGLYIIFNKETVPESFVDAFSKELQKFKTTDEYRSLELKYFGQR